MANHSGDAGKLIATDSSGTCGAIVWWTLKGVLRHDALKEALEDAGSPAVPPEEPSDLVALRSACVEVARVHRLEVRNVGRGEWALVRDPDVDEAAGKLEYDLIATARVAPSPSVPIEVKSSDIGIENELGAAFLKARGELSQAELSAWLCSKLERLGAVALRERGGIYFVPSDVTGKWQRVVKALGACGQQGLHNVPAMRSADAVESIMAALASEAESAVEALMAELALPLDDALGLRALATRQKQTEALMAKLERYENLLGKALPHITAKVDAARAAVVTAQSLAEQAADRRAEQHAAQ